MKQFLSLCTLLALLALTACGGAANTAQPSSAPAAVEATSAPATPTASAAPDAESAFPVTITHKYGEITIAQEPQRVVSLGYSEQDPLLALGVVPVAIRDWFGDQPYGVWPWAQDKLGSATPELLKMPFGEINIEKIASLKPDLIVATHSGITEDEYKLLQEIAPTLAQSGDYPDFGMPWQEQTRLIGKALGRSAQAEEVIAATEKAINDARAAHPEFAEASVAWISPAESGSFWAVGPSTPPMRFLSALGLQYGKELAEAVGDLDSLAISSEQLDLIDGGILVLAGASQAEIATILENPLLQQLDVVKGGRVITFALDEPIYGALSFSTVLSLPYAVEQLVPTIAAKLGGQASQANYPISIEHQFGTTVIPAPPERVIALGYTDGDAMLALDSVPIAVRYWFGEQPNGIWPWAEPKLGDAKPELLNMAFGELNLEKIASLQPDLILAVSAGISEDEYNLLSQIAPTLAQSGDYVSMGMPWDEQTKLIGKALGKEQLAERVVAEVSQRYEQARAQYPQFAGKSAVVAMPSFSGSDFLFSGPQHERQRFLTALGFQLPQELAEIAGDSFYGSISPERLDLFDVDVLIWTLSESERATLEQNAIYQQLKVVKEGRALYLDSSGQSDMAGPALIYATALSIPYAIDLVTPQLAAALDGDPQTVAP